MSTTAVVRGVRLSAQKGRLVADQIRGLPVDKALTSWLSARKKALLLSRRAWSPRLPMPSIMMVLTSMS